MRLVGKRIEVKKIGKITFCDNKSFQIIIIRGEKMRER